ncbi:efflux RND transporter periplasmic adaptor subunit [Clostridium septicum]|uniref:efflux RND transporter periplasmic adaptor subunit n=1 Tax=Clostridium septicum TaxID=1504 RepID=UPI0009F40D24|nr:efflux RND transporter periplasmic adaptor subunit [Clostridium septicum]
MKGSKIKSKKRLILISIGSIVIIAIVVALGFWVKAQNQSNGSSVEENTTEQFEITGNEGLSFKGVSVISKEQKIMADRTLGDIEGLNVSDKQEISEGDLLFTYSNQAILEEVKGVYRQIASANEKINRSNSKKAEISNEIAKYENELKGIKSKEMTPELEVKATELTQSIQAAQAKLEAEEATIATLKDSSGDLKLQKESLASKQNKEVKADINGIVYINEKGLTDPTVEYIRIVSKEPLIKAEVSEFDVESLKVDNEVQIKVVSNGDIVKGKIISIDELPTVSADGKGTSYNFYVKPEKAIRIGFSVEIKLNGEKIQIPKEYVYEEDSKLYIAKLKLDDKEEPFEKVEIKAELKGNNYSLIDGNVVAGDKLMKNPSELFKEDK